VWGLGLPLTTFKLKLQYRGTEYLGWQIQKDELKTIQGQLNHALKKITKSDEIKTIGSGRTDAGVHAIGQIVKAEIPLKIGAQELLLGLNSLMPKDISVSSCEEALPDFHPIYMAKKKEYRYLFTNQKEADPINLGLIANHSLPVDFSLMKEAASLFLGKHDFQNFFTTGSPVKSTVREIFESEVCEVQLPSFPFNANNIPVYQFRVVGEGFLKQMVRLMVGALWQIGRGKRSVKDLDIFLREKQTDRLGAVAPACGLYLYHVEYP
jgi:tRNA pseudouridine38-40 synthase